MSDTPGPLPIPDPLKWFVEGIDVASYQGTVDWPAVAASGRKFAFIKATQGTTYVNPTFGDGWAKARAAGLARGAYHYLDDSNPYDQAEHFLATVGPLQQFDIVALDVEEKFADPWKAAALWLGWVTYRVGFHPLIYTGQWFVDLYPIIPELAGFGLWQAAYQDTLPNPIAPWPFVAFWQYSDKGTCPGISGPVDLDRFNGPVDRLRLYGRP